MPGVSNGGFCPTPYRNSRLMCFAFDHALAQGTYLYPIIEIPSSARLTQVGLLIETAATNGSGTTVASIETSEGTPLVVLGSTAINLEATGFYDFYTAAGSGGPASAVTCRRRFSARYTLNFKVVIATADATVSAAGIIYVGLIDENLSA